MTELEILKIEQKALLANERKDISAAVSLFEQGMNACRLRIVENPSDLFGVVLYARLAFNAFCLRSELDKGSLRFDLNRLEALLSWALRALRLSGNKLSVVQTAVHMLVALGRFDQAIDMLSGFATGHPESAGVNTMIAEYHTLQGQHDRAALHARAALHLRPNDAVAARLLAEAEETVAAAEARSMRTARWPRSTREFDDLATLVRRHVIGTDASRAILRAGGRVLTMGSCFAQNLGRELKAYNLSVEIFPFSEDVNTTFANVAIFDAMAAGKEALAGIDLAALKAAVSSADVLILTLGVSQGFFHKSTEDYLLLTAAPLAVLRNIHENYRYRNISMAENVANLNRILEVVRALNPRLMVVLSVSPVPMERTFGQSSAVQADCLSKATLRVAAEEVVRSHGDVVLYWPAFEIAKWLSAHAAAKWNDGPAFGADDGYSRHVSQYVVDTIVDTFIRTHGDGSLAKLPSV